MSESPAAMIERMSAALPNLGDSAPGPEEAAPASGAPVPAHEAAAAESGTDPLGPERFGWLGK
ncbi:hypothetical protein JCM18882A_32120 [Brevibacterium metallidurans]|uniref:Uncharacterized protein n=1 Tax=Brevibacterium metallidurans TaxID=1482676 RepID=A0ABP3CBE7_9MICO